MLQARIVVRAVLIAKIKQVTAHQSVLLTISSESDCANDVCLGVRNIQGLPVSCERRRLRKCGLSYGTIEARFTTRSGEGRNLRLVEIQLPNLMRASHCDVKRAPDKL